MAEPTIEDQMARLTPATAASLPVPEAGQTANVSPSENTSQETSPADADVSTEQEAVDYTQAEYGLPGQVLPGGMLPGGVGYLPFRLTDRGGYGATT